MSSYTERMLEQYGVAKGVSPEEAQKRIRTGQYGSTAEFHALRNVILQGVKARDPEALKVSGPSTIGGTLIIPDPKTGQIIVEISNRTKARKIAASPEVAAAYGRTPATASTTAAQTAIASDREIKQLLNQLMGAYQQTTSQNQALLDLLNAPSKGIKYPTIKPLGKAELRQRAEAMGQLRYGREIAALQEAMRQVEPEYQKAMKSVDEYQKYMAKEFNEYANARGMFRSTLPMQWEKELVERTLGPQRLEIEDKRLRTLDSLNREIARLTGEQGLYTATTYGELVDKERAFQLDHAKFMEQIRQFETTLGLSKIQTILDEAHKAWEKMLDMAEISLKAKELNNKWGRDAMELYLKAMEHDFKVEQFLADRADQDWLQGFKERELALKASGTGEAAPSKTEVVSAVRESATRAVLDLINTGERFYAGAEELRTGPQYLPMSPENAVARTLTDLMARYPSMAAYGLTDKDIDSIIRSVYQAAGLRTDEDEVAYWKNQFDIAKYKSSYESGAYEEPKTLQEWISILTGQGLSDDEVAQEITRLRQLGRVK